MTAPTASEYLQFALQLADVAAGEILARFHTAHVEHKPDGSEVTDADRRAERVMRELIGETYPDHAVLGEEDGGEPGDTRYCWVLDPIDGTAWYALGIPKFGTLVALLDRGEPVVGVVHLPVTRETLFAEPGGGCWYRRGSEPPLRVQVDADVRALEDAFVSSAGVHRTDVLPAGHPSPIRLTNVLRAARRVRFVGDCVQHLLVARGAIHVAIDPKMQVWDIAALIPCVREAGGVISTVRGETDRLVFRDSLLSTCSRELHDRVVDILAS